MMFFLVMFTVGFMLILASMFTGGLMSMLPRIRPNLVDLSTIRKTKKIANVGIGTGIACMVGSGIIAIVALHR
jgi:hypothetical protein